MKITQYKIINTRAKKYRRSLNVQDIRLEFTKNNLLNINNKLEKSELINFGLELTPFTFSQITKVNNCEKAGSCILNCIFFTGKSNLMKSKNLELSTTTMKRIRKDFLLQNDKFFFIEKLKSELFLLNATYKTCAVRLNVVQDIEWTKLINFKDYPNIVFYDYTKVKNRLKKNSPIKFTYSVSEKDSKQDIINLLKKGFNVSMIIKGPLPKQWEGFNIINGDIDDNRYKDKAGSVVALKYKVPQGGRTDTKFSMGVE